jgi:ABC-type amino acid transport substrate-binding protein
MQGHDGVASCSWLGGLDPIPDFNPLRQMSSGVHFSFFGSFVFGTPGFPLSDVPLQQIATDAAAGRLDVVAAKTHGEGLAMLDDGKISAYFGDRSILLFLIKQSKAPDKLQLADDYLSVEPYALALPRGDGDFRLAVDRALSHIYRSGEIVSIFQRTFGGKAEPSQILRTLYVISSLPD